MITVFTDFSQSNLIYILLMFINSLNTVEQESISVLNLFFIY